VLEADLAVVAANPTPEQRFVVQLAVTRLSLARLLLDQKQADEARTLVAAVADDLIALMERGAFRPRLFLAAGEPPAPGERRRRELADLLLLLERTGLGARIPQLREAMKPRGR